MGIDKTCPLMPGFGVLKGVGVWVAWDTPGLPLCGVLQHVVIHTVDIMWGALGGGPVSCHMCRGHCVRGAPGGRGLACWWARGAPGGGGLACCHVRGGPGGRGGPVCCCMWRGYHAWGGPHGGGGGGRSMCTCHGHRTRGVPGGRSLACCHMRGGPGGGGGAVCCCMWQGHHVWGGPCGRGGGGRSVCTCRGHCVRGAPGGGGLVCCCTRGGPGGRGGLVCHCAWQGHRAWGGPHGRGGGGRSVCARCNGSGQCGRGALT